MCTIADEPRPQYRRNAACCIVRQQDGAVLAFERIGSRGLYQFPQGGIHADETPEQGAFRELFEETGIPHQAVECLSRTEQWLHYEWPERKQQGLLQRGYKYWRGQAQVWFLLTPKKDVPIEDHINLVGCGGEQPEFSGYRWMPLQDVVLQIRPNKRPVYQWLLDHWGLFVQQQYKKQNR
eukprot:TRINITY_DN12087_c1_g1_i1.p2 TRINITY_DN12087_c1_g1~~TRINITY_DN12087_c1_g1_i1.p2  ORF type:complete len:207 (+),score=19.28 TRINITY_DN12087_c1_g1_i1:83-622(+)